MVAKMCGSGAVTLLTSFVSLELMLLITLAMSGAALAIPVFYSSFSAALFGQTLYEFCVGMYWPAVMSLRGKIVSDATRSTTFNLFRVPLNIFVMTAMFQIEHLPEEVHLWQCITVWLGFRIKSS